jgi:hypothetical protein
MENEMYIEALINDEMSEYSDGAYADHGSARDSMERFAASVLSAYSDRIFVVSEKIDAEFGRENGPSSEWLKALADDMRSNAEVRGAAPPGKETKR